MPLLLGLLLDDDDARARRSQRDGDRRAPGRRRCADEACALREQHLIAELHPMLRLPLASLAFPVLRLRPRPELDAFLDTVHAVVHADGQVSLFEYCLGRLLQVQVRESLDPSRYARFGRAQARQRAQRVRDAAVRWSRRPATTMRAAAQRAYLAGMQRVLPRDHLPYAAAHADGVLALDAVWDALDALDPLAKQAMVEGHHRRDQPRRPGQRRPKPNCCARSAACCIARCRRCWNAPSRAVSQSSASDRRALGDHHRRRVRVAADQRRHHRGIDTRRPSTPRTRNCGSTTDAASLPMRQVPTGW